VTPGAAKQRPDQNQNSSQSQDIPISEWIAAIIGLILVVSAIGFLVYEIVRGDDEPPQLKISVTSNTAVGNQHLVKFIIVNHGGVTAAGVTVEGQLSENGQMIETATTTVSFVPPDSSRAGGLFFSHNPDSLQLEIRATGYEEP
jgi:uncharacterized protein (TIGR02588 family)